MRKFTILMALVAFASIAMAQVKMMPEYKSSFMKSSEIEKTVRPNQTKAVIWSVDFEETTPVWTTSLDPVGMPEWTIVNQASYPTLLGDFVDGWYFAPLGIYSLTGNGEENASEGHWALLNVIGHALPGGTGIDPPVIGESSIRFDNINLAAVSNPKIEWYQMTRTFNGNWYDNFVEVSVDGGTSWTSYPVNVGIAQGDNAPIFQDLAIPAAANEANVSIRFRWAQDRTATGGNALVGYGWQLDDISIVENSQYDIKLVDARMSFLTYADYHVANQEHLFHYSSHCGHLPVAQIGSENAYMWFNWIVENKGIQAATPTVKVVVSHELMGVVWEQEVVGVSMISGAIDTIDLLDDVQFQLNPAYIGHYEVNYEVFMVENEDENLTDNDFATEFNVTNDLYAKDLDNINGRFGLSGYTNMGISEEVIAADYEFTEDTEIVSGDVFINSITTPGTSFQMQLYTYNSVTDAWEVFAESTIYTVEESDLGTWMNCTWEDVSFLTVDTESLTTTIRAGIKTYYNNDDEDFYIGTDNSTSYGDFASFCYFKSGADWGWYYGMTDKALAIRLNVPYVTEVANVNANNVISVYPNPTYGALNIENVEGAQVQIINMMGQVVENITNAQMVNTVDMSKYADGTYFVKVINGNEVSTHKVNLMK